MLLLIVAAFLLSATEGAQGTYQQIASIGGSLRSYKTLASWDEARERCRREGAVLASPITKELQKELQTLFQDASHFIGVDARLHDSLFVSVGGVLFEDMPVTDMYQRLDLDDGECLSMNRQEIRVEQCTSRLPYACYKNETEPMNVTRTCKTSGYTYYENTNSCYKIYRKMQTWLHAKSTCEAEDAQLVVIDDANEALTLKQLGLIDGYPHTFIGLQRNIVTGRWQYVNGIDVGGLYDDWHSGEPDRGYDCGIIRISGKIDNYGCNENREFICEQ